MASVKNPDTAPGRSGSATLITLLVFMVIAISIIATSVAILITNSQMGTTVEQGMVAYDAAENGIENAMIRLLRDPSYTGETMTAGDQTTHIAVSGSGPYTVTSTGTSGTYVRKIQAIINNTGGVLTISSWKEIHP